MGFIAVAAIFWLRAHLPIMMNEPTAHSKKSPNGSWIFMRGFLFLVRNTLRRLDISNWGMTLITQKFSF